MALLSRFFGRTVSEGTAYAFGVATGPVLAPATEQIRQEAWKVYQSRIPAVAELAAGVARGKVDAAAAKEWAARQGFSGTVFDTLVTIAELAPDVNTAMRAWRRGKLTDGQFATVLERSGLAAEWREAVESLKLELLSPGEIAAAIHRGLIPDPGLLKGEQPQPPFNVEPYPVYDIPAIQEAAGSGYDHDRLGVLVGLQGLPMGPHEAAQALFRGIITKGDYIRAFNESNNRNEWAEALLAQARQIPTARDFLENALRGYRTLDEALAGAALHGMSPEHATLIYQNQGRPMPVRRITQALARGGKFQPEPGEIKDPYRAAIVEGSLKPAYYDLEEAMKYTPPSVFAIRQLAQSGTWDQAKVSTRLKWLGWIPEDADEVAQAWTQTTAAGADPHITKAQTQLWTATHASYLNREASATVARQKLAQAGVANSAITAILGIWDHERELIRKGLTPANVKKAYQKGSRNNATGKPWTRDEAIAFLVGIGWSANEANDYLDIP